jgi:hypothetical protein
MCGGGRPVFLARARASAGAALARTGMRTGHIEMLFDRAKVQVSAPVAVSRAACFAGRVAPVLRVSTPPLRMGSPACARTGSARAKA